MISEPTLSDYVREILHRKQRFLVSFLFVNLLAFLYLAFATRRYEATTTFVEASKTSSSRGEGRTGELAALSSLLAAAGEGNNNAFYLGLLQSNMLRDRIIADLHLLDHFKVKTIQSARRRLKRFTVFKEEKGEIIRLVCLDADRQMAQRICSAYMDQLNSFLKERSLTESQRNLEFLEGRIAVAQQELGRTNSEREFRVKEGVYITLQKEFELARARVARERLTVFTIDESESSIEPTQPDWVMTLALAFVASFFIGLAWILFSMWRDSMKETHRRIRAIG